MVSGITEGLYNKSFLDELLKAGVVYNKDETVPETTLTQEERDTVAAGLEKLLKQLDEEGS